MRPVLFELFGMPIYSYPLLMGIGWGVGFNVIQSHWLKRGYRLNDLRILFIGNFLTAWIGAKVFFLLFSTPDKIGVYSQAANFWLGGGFVFYGGLVFASLFTLILCLKSKTLKFSHLALLVPGLCLGHAIGRVGCFLAGCCYGNICHLPIAVVFHNEPRHPVQLYEVAGLLALFYLCQQLVKQNKDKLAVIWYFLGYSTLRFLLEFFRGDEIRGRSLGLSTSQWVSLCIVTCVMVTLFIKKKEIKS